MNIKFLILALLLIVLPTSPLDLIIIPFIIASIGLTGYFVLVAALLLMALIR